MDPSSLALIGIALVTVVAAAGVLTVSSRRSVAGHRGGHAPGPPEGSVERRPPSGFASAVSEAAAPEAVGETEPSVAKPVRIVTQQRVVEVSPEEGGVTRRQFFNRALTGSFAAFLAVLGLDGLAFFWPRLSGGFGTRVDAGPVSDIKAQLLRPDGLVQPYVVSDARAYVVPITPEEAEESQFNQTGLVVDGLMAMWWRCVHLGCRTPWCAPSVGFECPCHGSKYNLLGEYQDGPAPRNLDRFAVEVNGGRLIIDTGTIVQTPRAPRDTVPYPRGPSCISL